MSSNNQVRIRNFNDIVISDISFKEPVKIKGSYVTLAHIDDEEIYIQTPKIINLNGIIKTDTRAHIDLFFEKHHLNFYEFLSNMDDNNVLKTFNNSQTWFNKSFPIDIVEDLYSTPLKHKNPPKFKLKIPLSKGDIDTQIYDITNTQINYDDIPINSKLVFLLKFVGLKFLKDQVIAEWTPVQIKICQEVQKTYSSNNYLIDDAIISDNEANDDEVEVEAEAEVEANDDEVEAEAEEEDDDDVDTLLFKNDDTLEEININEIMTKDYQEPDYKNMVESIKVELDEYKNNYKKKEDELVDLKNSIRNYINK
jgi:hypothetical protein